VPKKKSAKERKAPKGTEETTAKRLEEGPARGEEIRAVRTMPGGTEARRATGERGTGGRNALKRKREAKAQTSARPSRPG